jgi:hypothetical protein
MVGNNVIVETMFRHQPGVMLYAPLRGVTEVGTALDAKLAALLRLMPMPVPPELETEE